MPRAWRKFYFLKAHQAKFPLCENLAWCAFKVMFYTKGRTVAFYIKSQVFFCKKYWRH